MKFSIIIPMYNAQDTILSCIASVFAQTCNDYEVICVDDCSTDGTLDLLKLPYGRSINIQSTNRNSGPGIARNVGLMHAQGDWIIFLDADDALMPDALEKLSAFIDDHRADAIGYNWCQMGETTPRRVDGQYLGTPQLLSRYLRLQMDGSVIFTAFRAAFLDEIKLEFYPGLHEDIDFMYHVYGCALETAYLDEVLYQRRIHPKAITQSVSKRHIHGFVFAWGRIGDWMERWDEEYKDYEIGTVAVVATRVREIVKHVKDAQMRVRLYGLLYAYLTGNPDIPTMRADLCLGTKYESIARKFYEIMGSEHSDDEKEFEITEFTRDIMTETWSCKDIHESVFLAPDQVRTCCKRFFVNEEMRGDVVLINDPKQISIANIYKAKQELHAAINRGDKTDCDGCPFMEFKDWGEIKTKYLSLEHHSVCNLKCSYCSDTYYGGKQPAYDVKALVSGIDLSEAHTVVWGGGEPTIGKDFDDIVDTIPIKQRVLTNAVKYSPKVAELLAQDRITITTSVDAGTSFTFAKVRGVDKLAKVMENLSKYAAIRPENVTVKYIFTVDNSTSREVNQFCMLVKAYGLTQCNFQISSNFKAEAVYDAKPIVELYQSLINMKVRLVFMDDLLRQRLNTNIEGVENPENYHAVVVWGAGYQARYLMEESQFFKRVPVAYFVDDTPDKIGSTYYGRHIHPSDKLLEGNEPILIAATQAYPAIYERFKAMGIDENRLIKGIVL